jgi:hypothetical protein
MFPFPATKQLLKTLQIRDFKGSQQGFKKKELLDVAPNPDPKGDV